MKLDDAVAEALWTYTGLYFREQRPDLSRLNVLYSLFGGCGTGYWWRDGYLAGTGRKGEKYGQRKFPPLEPSFFQRVLYEADVSQEATRQAFETFCDERRLWCYVVERAPGEGGRYTLMVDLPPGWEVETIRKSLPTEGELHQGSGIMFFRCDDSDRRMSQRPRDLPRLTTIYDSSPLACIPDDVRPDWLAGAQEVARSILEIFSDPSSLTWHDEFYEQGWEAFVQRQLGYAEAALVR